MPLDDVKHLHNLVIDQAAGCLHADFISFFLANQGTRNWRSKGVAQKKQKAEKQKVDTKDKKQKDNVKKENKDKVDSKKEKKSKKKKGDKE